MEESGSAGLCPHCAAPHSRGALFCWQCGATLMERSPSTALDGEPADSTAVMDRLLEPTDGAMASDAGGGADGASTVVMDALLAPDGAASEASPSADG